MRYPIAVLAALAGLSLSAPAAAQGPVWSEGDVLYTQGLNCTSIIFNNSRLESQTFAYASQQLPQTKQLPFAGDVFYVRLSFGSIGDICGGGGQLLPDFLPPDGVDLVLGDKRYPPYWTVTQNSQEQEGKDGTVVITPGPGNRTALVGAAAPEGTAAWPYANSGGFISVVIPMRARQRLNGLGTAAPNCPQRDDGTPCPQETTGDWLQVIAHVADGGAPGTLIPVLGLFAREPRPPTLKLPTRPRARRFTLTARTAPAFRVRARLGGQTVTAHANADGVATLRLRVRPGRMKLSVTTIADDGSASAAVTRSVRLR